MKLCRSPRLQFLAAIFLALVLAACGDDGGDSKKNNGGTNNGGTNNGGTNNGGTNNGGTNNGGTCAGKTTCDTEGTSCQGDTLVTCAEDADGCLVETTEDCTANGGTCDDSGAAAQCSTSCQDDALCDGLSDGDTICDGPAVVTCTDQNGCLVANETPCDSGETCDDSSGTAACMAAGDCAEAVQTLSCADAGTTINGNTANGTSIINEACSVTNYSSKEEIYVFEATDISQVTVEVDTTSDADLDILAMDAAGAACSQDLSCLDAGQSVSTPEEAVFDVMDGQVVYLVVDQWATTPAGGVEYTLDINCETPTCGDGVVGAFEECDDNNTDTGDGCSDTCTVETDYVCDDSEPSVCRPDVCGDGLVSANEECDDNNTDDNDGCSSTCEEETDYVCDDSEPSVCTPDICGDGIVSANEECDDNNTDTGDGCSDTCTFEFGQTCTGEPSTCMALTSIGTFAAGDTIPDTTGGALAEDESARYLIEFTETVNLSGSLTSTSGDPDLRITDSEGNRVVVEANNGNEMFSDQLVGAGTYEVRITAFTAIPDYTLTLSSVGISSAGSFAAGDTISDQTGSQLDLGDSQYMEFTFTDDVMLTGSLTSTTGDADLFVLGSDGEFITQTADDGDEPNIQIGLTAGTYLFEVNAWDGAMAGVDAFTLSLSTSALSVPDIGTFAAGDTIADVNGSMITARDFVHRTITFTDDVLLDAEISGYTTGAAVLMIYDETGNFVATDATATAVPVPAGDYIVQVMTFSAAIGGGDVDTYTISLSTVAQP